MDDVVMMANSTAVVTNALLDDSTPCIYCSELISLRFPKAFSVGGGFMMGASIFFLAPF